MPTVKLESKAVYQEGPWPPNGAIRLGNFLMVDREKEYLVLESNKKNKIQRR